MNNERGETKLKKEGKIFTTKYFSIFACVVAIIIQPTFSQDFSRLVEYLNDATVVAQDEKSTYLGKISNSYNTESIFNEYGKFGGNYSSTSIWNEYGKFGGEYNSFSAFNPNSSKPPMVIKRGKVIAYLTVNKSIEGAVSPNILKAIKDQF